MAMFNVCVVITSFLSNLLKFFKKGISEIYILINKKYVLDIVLSLNIIRTILNKQLKYCGFYPKILPLQYMTSYIMTAIFVLF